MFAGRTGRDRRHQRHQASSKGAGSDRHPSTRATLRPRDSRPGLRDDLSSGTEGESQFLPSNDDPLGPRLHSGRQRVDRDVQRERRYRQRWRALANCTCKCVYRTALSCGRLRATLIVALVLTFLIACARRGDPKVVLDHATQTFRRGDVASAEKEAQVGYERFQDLGSEWSWKFRLLKADALAWRGMNDRLLVLLSSETTSPPSEELSLRKERLEGLAYTGLHRLAEAEHTLALP